MVQLLKELKFRTLEIKVLSRNKAALFFFNYFFLLTRRVWPESHKKHSKRRRCLIDSYEFVHDYRDCERFVSRATHGKRSDAETDAKRGTCLALGT
jgi:hypothetical protein